MKNRNLIFIILWFSIILLTTNETKATTPAGNDDILLIPKAAYAPKIDGQLDQIWCNVTNNRMLIFRGGILPSNWLDFYSSFRVMWDDDNFYLFVSIHDEFLFNNHSDFWENDEIELFIDGDNSKNSEATGYDENDVHLHFPFDLVPQSYGKISASLMNYAYLKTDLGWNMELAIPFTAMPFQPNIGHEFGFSICSADNDNQVQREHYVRWWSTYLYIWLNPSSWGTAKLTDRVVSDTLDVNYTETKPQIDGNTDEVWAGVSRISHNTYVTDDSLWDINLLNDWKDLQFDYQVMWDDDYFYALIQVIDDKKYNQQTNPWDNDGVELYFDGDNSKTEGSYDENDDRLIFVCKGSLTSVHSHIDTSNIEYAYALKGEGWSLELAIPFANLKFNPTVDHQFGFEIQINDNDGGETRENMARWWSNTIELEQNPALFGTVKLVKVSGTDVETPKNSNVIDDYYLAQNYPNPFNAETVITYKLPVSEHVRLEIFNIMGQKVRTLVNELHSAGQYLINWDGENDEGHYILSGIYIYKITAGGFKEVKKMTVLR